MMINGLEKNLMDSLKIMIVEDEADICDLLSDYLEMKGCKNISKISTGKEANIRIELEKPDVIFLDIQLADNVRGLEVLKKTKELLPNAKVVMMSAYKEEHGQESQELGAYDFLKKPFHTDSVDQVLKRIFGQKEGEN